MRPFTIWTAPVVAALTIEHVNHIIYDTDVMDATCDRWIASGSSHCPAITMRHVGRMELSHYIANGPALDLPPLPEL